jgi:hypothetical protein
VIWHEGQPFLRFQTESLPDGQGELPLGVPLVHLARPKSSGSRARTGVEEPTPASREPHGHSKQTKDERQDEFNDISR